MRLPVVMMFTWGVVVTCSRTGTRLGTDKALTGLRYENTGLSESVQPSQFFVCFCFLLLLLFCFLFYFVLFCFCGDTAASSTHHRYEQHKLGLVGKVKDSMQR